MAASEREIMIRAQQIFERENPGDKRWGTVTNSGRQAFRMEISEGPNQPPVRILSPEERAPYVDQARKELALEGDA